MQTLTPTFWRLDIGNVLTIFGVVAAWTISKVWDARGVKDEVVAVKRAQIEHKADVEKWRNESKLESAARDKITSELHRNVDKLTVIADYSERRLSILESREKPGSIERIHERIDQIAKAMPEKP